MATPLRPDNLLNSLSISLGPSDSDQIYLESDSDCEIDNSTSGQARRKDIQRILSRPLRCPPRYCALASIITIILTSTVAGVLIHLYKIDRTNDKAIIEYNNVVDSQDISQEIKGSFSIEVDTPDETPDVIVLQKTVATLVYLQQPTEKITLKYRETRRLDDEAPRRLSSAFTVDYIITVPSASRSGDIAGKFCPMDLQKFQDAVPTDEFDKSKIKDVQCMETPVVTTVVPLANAPCDPEPCTDFDGEIWTDDPDDAENSANPDDEIFSGGKTTAEEGGEKKDAKDNGKPPDDDKPKDNGKPIDDNKPKDNGKPPDDDKPKDNGKPTDDNKPKDNGKPPTDDNKPKDNGKPTDDNKPKHNGKPTDDNKAKEDKNKPTDKNPKDDEKDPKKDEKKKKKKHKHHLRAMFGKLFKKHKKKHKKKR